MHMELNTVLEFLSKQTLALFPLLIPAGVALPLLGLHKPRLVWMLLWQLGCAVVGALAGFQWIGPAVFEASGGCSAHGGAFEGNCGFAGMGYNISWALLAAAIAPLIGGLLARGFLRISRPRDQ